MARDVPEYNVVGYGVGERGERQLCCRCFSLEVAHAGGIDDERVHFAPLILCDADGFPHTFQFRAVAPPGGGILLEAFVREPPQREGYEFAVFEPRYSDLFNLKALLLQRMRRGLARAYLELGADGASHIRCRRLAARISCEVGRDQVPLLVVDGREVSWKEFGRMLVTFEGFELRLQLREKSAVTF